MVENIEDVTIAHEEAGEVVVEEIDKRILSKGAWSTVIFKFREWDARKEAMSEPKYTIRRYQKRNGVYSQRAKFNISSDAQARQLVEVLTEWLGG